MASDANSKKIDELQWLPPMDQAKVVMEGLIERNVAGGKFWIPAYARVSEDRFEIYPVADRDNAKPDISKHKVVGSVAFKKVLAITINVAQPNLVTVVVQPHTRITLRTGSQSSTERWVAAMQDLLDKLHAAESDSGKLNVPRAEIDANGARKSLLNLLPESSAGTVKSSNPLADAIAEWEADNGDDSEDEKGQEEQVVVDPLSAEYAFQNEFEYETPVWLLVHDEQSEVINRKERSSTAYYSGIFRASVSESFAVHKRKGSVSQSFKGVRGSQTGKEE